MANLSIKLNLLALKNAGVASLTGKTGTKKCIIIPIDDNNLFQGQSGIYMSLVAWRNNNLDDGKTHLVKPSFSKDQIEAMTDLERKAIPIVGDVKPWGRIVDENPDGYTSDSVDGVGNEDLPF